MLRILLAFFLAAASALRITSPQTGSFLLYNSPFTIFFDTEDAVINNFTIRLNDRVICEMEGVTGKGSCNALASEVNSNNQMRILAHGITTYALRVSSLVTVNITAPYPGFDLTAPPELTQINSLNLWQPSNTVLRRCRKCYE